MPPPPLQVGAPTPVAEPAGPLPFIHYLHVCWAPSLCLALRVHSTDKVLHLHALTTVMFFVCLIHCLTLPSICKYQSSCVLVALYRSAWHNVSAHMGGNSYWEE